ncbi:MAG: hypothetical protein JRN06_09550 [Nitrososphaerota archaeon]|nr:hypothetical protein [Nitrososphaerota archaeon]MDG7024830.1 hypothetical protein [Nitrososphaerota archaeon]
MDRADVSSLFAPLVPVGTVEAVRQEYQVFRTAGGDFLVFSPSNRGSLSFHMTHVPAVKVQALSKVVGREEVTSGSLLKDGRLEDAFGSEDKVAMRFDLLIALYVLVAQGSVEMKKEGRNLVFRRRKVDA